MDAELVPIEDLSGDPANVRKHSKRNLDVIKASLKRFGQQKPIVVNADNVVVAGNGTLMAADALGWKDIRVVRTSLKGAEATAYAIADNRTAELAEWAEAELAETLAALQIEDEDLAAATGFSEEEFAKLVGAEPEQTDADEKMGDLEFRIIVECRDESHQADLLARLEEEGVECRALMS